MAMTSEQRTSEEHTMVLEVHGESIPAKKLEKRSYQAYQTLHFGFTAAPIIAGLDKFTHVLVNWDQYLAPWVARLSPVSPHSLMLGVGVIEIIAGLLVAVKPRYGAYVVSAWLMGIVV